MAELYGKEFKEVGSREEMFNYIHLVIGKKEWRGGIEFGDNTAVYRVDKGSECNRVLAFELINENKCYVETFNTQEDEA